MSHLFYRDLFPYVPFCEYSLNDLVYPVCFVIRKKLKKQLVLLVSPEERSDVNFDVS